MKCLPLLHHQQKDSLAIRLPSYKPLNILLRFSLISVIAVGILHLMMFFLSKPENGGSSLKIYLTMIIAFNMAAEIQIILDNVLERLLPVPKKIKLRLFFQIIFGITSLIMMLMIIKSILEPQLSSKEAQSGVFFGLLSGLVFVQMVANSLTIGRLTQKMFNAQEEIDEMKQEKLKMDYNLLQDQLNPHFLFNNLSVLKSLIIYDKDTAVNFTENFTDVYRYVLQSKDKLLVKFKDELEFMKAYGSLHKERLGEGISINVDINEEDLYKDIAPLTAQLLIENAVKHNITSRENPLHIEVYSKNNYLVVSNNLNIRESSYSTKTGLKNLAKRYTMLSEKEVEVYYNDKRFEVRVPLL